MTVRAFSGGQIRTMQAGDTADLLVIEGERIVDVGDRSMLDRYPDAERRDLAGRVLVPGLIDAHNHLSVAALHPRWADVGRVRNREELIEVVRSRALAEPATRWIRCFGWDESRTDFTPTRQDLDEAGLDRPVLVAHFSLHQGVVNSVALDELGIGRQSPDPPGGEILRDPSGEPSGFLLERAWSEAHRRSMLDYADPDRWADHIVTRAEELLSDGITAVHDAACSPEAEAVYRGLARSRRLPISVVMLPHSAALLSNDPNDRLDGPVSGEGDERCRVGAIKLFADGGIAIAIDATIGGRPVRFGMVMEDLGTRGRDAADRGFSIAVHAIGNVGVDAALALFEEVRRLRGADCLLRLEHAGVTGPDQWRRLASLGAIAVVQPGFVEHVGRGVADMLFDDHHWLAFRGLQDSGVELAGSSDDPCAPVAPLWGARRGESRATSTGVLFEPDQSVPFDDWLRAYTIGAARAGGQEEERGSLARGKRADLAVLNLDPGGAARVDETWVAGELVYAKP
ncbi:MAG TPA: amidohydrolase [Acidimicrobiales bacterium]|nr:amidohydrolase [Acidimicrobiales bacterium]